MLLLCAPGCGHGPEVGGDDAGQGACTTALDCDDGVYCNGPEQCVPGDGEGSPSTCVAGVAPCGSGACSESSRACVAECDPTGDRDNDGVVSVACGGSDCDDDDPNRFPGNPEVCDALGHDEDCDPSTLGPDLDLDQFISDMCCNTQPGGELLCGLDCDDTRIAVNPAAIDDCNAGVDDDCDGEVDENPEFRFYRDFDGDGYGVTTDFVMRCGAPPGYSPIPGDCNDMFPNVNPGVVTDICDGAVDHNCDGFIDETCGCVDNVDLPCGISDIGICTLGVQQCVGGLPQACSAVFPEFADEQLCDGRDEDCDRTIDEGLQTLCYPDGDSDGFAAAGAAPTPRCVCGAGTTALAPDSPSTTDCNDATAQVNPNQLEVCDATGRDENCNGQVDEGLRVHCYPDQDSDSYAPLGSTFVSRCACLVQETTRVPVASVFDCNDANAAQHPSAGEACDAAMLDEDCDGETNEDCACSGTATRPCSEAGFLGACGQATQTCDSGTWSACPTTTGPEVCGGGDENCNGAFDENQPCSPLPVGMGGDAPRSCNNGCPTAATQTCSAGCVWGTCQAAEVCNYCDDDNDGSLADDAALATTTQSQGVADDDTVVFGDATRVGAAVLFGPSDNTSGAGSAMAPFLTLGYGTLVIEGTATLLCNHTDAPVATHGWALFLLTADGRSTKVGAAADQGVPYDRVGYAAQWRWRNVGDRGYLRALAHPGDDPILRSATLVDNAFGAVDCDGTSSATFTQRLRMTIHPDDPSTGVNETEVCVDSIDGAGNVLAAVGCCESATEACGPALQTGDRIRLALSLGYGANMQGFIGTARFTATQGGTCAP
ncbi:MAG: putative metal-binding motif-containing protein [Polyangiales bacterium]|nr:putative metal-binding motif-containing protein [Myxococcales bacterium]MCB9658073.1 putative metal-binding motif-containing protein [Sandaracinaceae bacterium]